MEIFKTIKEYPNYSVSTEGRIKKNSNNRLMKPTIKSNGYMQINLFTGDGRRKKEYVHRLVALTFIPNVNHFPEVNHIDGIRDHNNVSNLEWVTHEENMKKAVFLNKSIRVKNKSGEIVGEFYNIETACSALSLTGSNVSACLHGSRQKTHKGYTFEFIDCKEVNNAQNLR